MRNTQLGTLGDKFPRGTREPRSYIRLLDEKEEIPVGAGNWNHYADYMNALNTPGGMPHEEARRHTIAYDARYGTDMLHHPGNAAAIGTAREIAQKPHKTGDKSSGEKNTLPPNAGRDRI